MKTITPTQIPLDARKWYIVDAKGQTLGRLASRLATIISGKDRVDFSPHMDNGDYVIVLNTAEIVVTGNKEEAKLYRTHSGHMGHLKEVKLSKLRAEKPNKILEHAISGMLPKNRLRSGMMFRLKLVDGATHGYESQNPTTITL
ncbi:MAG: 50S ribosomal protein L13 [Candidatus Gracilibacteria bacterium]|nr:50S ribosomal protein L13 [Candidatus Gracilibacteria bacterium]